MDMKGHTIALIGGFESGKTSFIKSVRAAVNGSPSGIPPAEEKPTLGIDEYNVPLPNGQSLTFLDTPGFDGYQAGDGHAKETEEILQMLEEHLAAKGTGLVSHVLFFMNANDMVPTEFKGRARRTFERLFANSKLACISTRWDQIENDDGLPVTAEEAKVKEESIYDMGRTSGSFLEYLFGGQVNNGDEVLRFRSGLPIEAYSSPQDIIHKLLPRSVSRGKNCRGVCSPISSRHRRSLWRKGYRS
ncbi:hypothetical protein DFP72DRAFT_845709 [Ephemerocybe angulata]|uniref:G domain-containing protein n=1 Tax=Ephemerocybe angulata TaxID=980116 RepID=A0A8H6I2M0_9AGAR|nr:hypothetical protein DFP72DRAFT_845709 [Tulosesus angulatus]